MKSDSPQYKCVICKSRSSDGTRCPDKDCDGYMERIKKKSQF
jgi:hypothetical protein